jgi:hypothetical protein
MLQIDEFICGKDQSLINPESQNLFQFWDKEMDPTDDKIDVLKLDNPINDVLQNFENNQDDMIRVHQAQNFEIDQNFYNPEDNESECLLGASYEELEKDLNDSFDNRQFESYEENHKKLNSPFSAKTKTNLELMDRLKLRRRDLKHNTKRIDDALLSRKTNYYENSKANHMSSSPCDNKSGLIIKICSGSNVIINKEFKNQVKKMACTDSTQSNDKQDGRRMSQVSFSSIELNNNVKIICRSIGPLKAEERKQKVLNYLEKKRTRKWNKRINYAYVLIS